MSRGIAYRTLQIVVVVFVGVSLLVGTLLWRSHRQSALASKLQTVAVKRSDLIATISATGTVEPEEVVDIGAQVAGKINSFGKDKNGKSVDYGSVIDEGTVLAQIDDSLYTADVEVAKAQRELARAGQLRAEADLLQMRAKLDQAQRDWDRAQKLGPSEALAPTAYDAYKANYEIAKANVAVDQAAIEQAKSTRLQAQATLDRAERNLGYCTIKSPVKGVIVDRRVNIGQTVVSSLNAPSLFLIAKDLTRIQVWVSVNEADIGHIHPGMPVTFTVDALANRVFHGQVGKVRLNASMTQNVVTYTVEVNTDNSDGKLLPYLTANVQFVIGNRENVLAVPNAALRWQPPTNQIAPEFRKTTATPSATSGRRSSFVGTPQGPAEPRGTIWVPQGDLVRPVIVSIGLTDGTLTEIQGADLAEGMRVIVGEQSQQASGGPGPGASPFTPQIGRSRSTAATTGPAAGGRPGGAP